MKLSDLSKDERANVKERSVFREHAYKVFTDNCIHYSIDSYEPGQVLFECGKPAKAAFLIVKGAVVLYTEENGDITYHHMITEGQVLGDFELLPHQSNVPYQVSAKALDTVRAVRIPAAQLRRLRMDASTSPVSALCWQLAEDAAAKGAKAASCNIRARAASSPTFMVAEIIWKLCQSKGVKTLPIQEIRNHAETCDPSFLTKRNWDRCTNELVILRIFGKREGAHGKYRKINMEALEQLLSLNMKLPRNPGR